MQSYDSQVTNHVGYIIGISIGVAALIFNKDILEFFRGTKLILFLVILSFSVSSIVYFASRITYWSWMRSAVLAVTEEMVASEDNAPLIKKMECHLINDFKRVGTPKKYIFFRINRFFFKLDYRLYFPISWVLFFVIASFILWVSYSLNIH